MGNIEDGKVATDNDMVDLDLLNTEEVVPDEKTSVEEGTQPELPPAVEADTETETTPDESVDTETETTQEPDLAELFRQQGLNERFADPAAMMRDQNRYITEIEQERSSLKREREELQRQLQTRQVQRQETTELDQDKFLEDPVGILKSAGLVTEDSVNRMLDERDRQIADQNSIQRAQAFRASKDDFDSLDPVMSNLALKYPGIRAMPTDEAVEVLYEMASRGKKTVVQPADTSKKNRASTSGGTSSTTNKGGTAPENTLDYLPGETDEAYEKRIGYGNK